MISRDSQKFSQIDQLAEEFAARLRKGESPTLQEYLDRYPDLADEIRELFPAMVEIEQIKMACRQAEERLSAPPREMPEQIGDFRLLREIGRGGMGVVYEAEQISLARHVALKILAVPGPLDARQLSRFQREAKAAARLHHTNIVPVYGVGEQGGVHYYVMQFIQGLGLDEVLVELRRLRQPQFSSDKVAEGSRPSTRRSDLSAVDVAQSLLTGFHEQTPGEAAASGLRANASQSAKADERPPSERNATRSLGNSSMIHLPGQPSDGALGNRTHTYWKSVARIGVQVADALKYAHSQNTLHRDIKPSNLLLDTRATVWVTDFGLAKAVDDCSNLTLTGDIAGTLRYLAPERLEGQSDASGDIYALGLTLYELVTLRPAFDEADRSLLLRQVLHADPLPPHRIDPTVPRDLEIIIQKASARKPAHRYRSAEELAADLQRFIDDKPIRARRVSRVEHLIRWARQNKRVAALLATIAVLLAVGGLAAAVAAFYFRQQEHAQRLLAAEKEAERSKAVSAQGDAEKQRDMALRNQYLADMRVAHEDWTAGHVSRLYTTLGKYVPAAGQTDLRGWEWYYLLSLCHQDLKTLRGHTDRVFSVAWRSDGKQLASASSDGTLRIWQPQTGQAIRSIQAAKCPIRRVAWSPDGSRLVTIDRDNTIKLWNAHSGSLLKSLLGHEKPTFGICWSPDGSRLASCSAEEGIYIWDAGTGQLLRTVRFEAAAEGPFSPLAITWSPDGKRIAAGHYGVDVLDAADGRRLIHFTPSDETFCLAWSPDGERLATGSYGSAVAVWDAATGKPIWSNGETVAVESVAWSADGRHVATASRSQKVSIRDAATGRTVSTFQGHVGWVHSVSWSPDSRHVASAGADGTIKLWDVRAQETVSAAALSAGLSADSPDGRRRAVAKADGTISIVDAASGELGRTFIAYEGSPSLLRWLPDGTLLQSGNMHDWHSHYKLWHADTGQLVREGLGNVSPDGKLIAFSPPKHDHVISVCDTLTGQVFRSWQAHNSSIFAPRTWSPDSKRLATAGYGDIKIWDVATGQQLHALYGHAPGRWIGTLVWSLDGQLLASGGWDHSVKVWHTLTGRLVHSLEGTGNMISGVAFSPDGARLLSYTSGNVRIWDTLSGREMLNFNIPNAKVGHWDVRWSADGRRITGVGGSVIDASKGFEFADSPDFREDLALAQLDRRQEAEVTAFVADNSNDLAWKLLTSTNPDHRDPARAVALARKAVEVAPKNGIYWATLGAAHYRAGNWAEALRSLEQARELQKSEAAPEIEGYLALTHVQLGNKRALHTHYASFLQQLNSAISRREELLRLRTEIEVLLGK